MLTSPYSATLPASQYPDHRILNHRNLQAPNAPFPSLRRDDPSSHHLRPGPESAQPRLFDPISPLRTLSAFFSLPARPRFSRGEGPATALQAGRRSSGGQGGSSAVQDHRSTTDRSRAGQGSGRGLSRNQSLMAAGMACGMVPGAVCTGP